MEADKKRVGIYVSKEGPNRKRVLRFSHVPIISGKSWQDAPFSIRVETNLFFNILKLIYFSIYYKFLYYKYSFI